MPENLALLVPTFWLGILIGISFIATPVKFQAASLTRPVALDIGRATRRLCNLRAVYELLLVPSGQRGLSTLKRQRSGQGPPRLDEIGERVAVECSKERIRRVAERAAQNTALLDATIALAPLQTSEHGEFLLHIANDGANIDLGGFPRQA